jgi:hypothetical protein
MIETKYVLEPQVNSYPASEKMIREVERGQTWSATLLMAPERAPSAGDSIIFAAAYSRDGYETSYSLNGDSVRVLLTGVTDLGRTDPATGQVLFRLSWQPLGQERPSLAAAKRVPVSRGSLGRA